MYSLEGEWECHYHFFAGLLLFAKRAALPDVTAFHVREGERDRQKCCVIDWLISIFFLYVGILEEFWLACNLKLKCTTRWGSVRVNNMFFQFFFNSHSILMKRKSRLCIIVSCNARLDYIHGSFCFIFIFYSRHDKIAFEATNCYFFFSSRKHFYDCSMQSYIKRPRSIFLTHLLQDSFYFSWKNKNKSMEMSRSHWQMTKLLSSDLQPRVI